MILNDRAWKVADELEANAELYRVAVTRIAGTRIIDCGIHAEGSINAGLLLSRACLSDLGSVSLAMNEWGPSIFVQSDEPVRACLASQYAGMQIKVEKFFAMGSGPMRAAAAREEIFTQLAVKENPTCAVGILETRNVPTGDVIASIVSKLPTTVEKLTLLIAPAASLAGTIQVVARSLETALHKLHELKFDVRQIVSGCGIAPLPPVGKDEITSIGRTNDAILFGGQVTLWVKCDDAEIEKIGPAVPSSASKDYGSPFAEIFNRYGGDFYKIDPMLFSPAQVTFHNLKTGRLFSFGQTNKELLQKSMAS